ncbi:MAG TPA: hypothetical protein H9794_05610 [Candidatus Mediterraneibacter merdigallinarum]|nr:hypothetical protein [Candidatus Mediterraneibacter merdigallinarum]
MQIVTGKTGTPHVTSQQFRQFIEGTVGQGSYILNSAENLEPELVTNNKLKIRSGMMCHHGNLSVVEIGTYDEVTIPNGTQGMKRVILIANRYTRNEETGIEECEWHKFIGASDPDEFKEVTSYTEGNLQEGDLVDDCPVFEIHQDGLNVTEIKKLLTVATDIPAINASLTDLSETESAELRNNFNTLFGYAERRGKQVSITSVFAANQWTYQTANWITIGTLPETMRPSRQQNGVAIYGNNQDSVTGLRVLTTGEVQVYFPVGTNRYLSFSISFLIE